MRVQISCIFYWEKTMKRILTLLATLLVSSQFAFAAVNINTATAEELDAVKTISPAKAKAIVDYRTQNGPFKSLDELKKVKGFGEKSVAKAAAELSISGPSTAPVKTAKKK
jgi:competence protein ComEA